MGKSPHDEAPPLLDPETKLRRKFPKRNRRESLGGVLEGLRCEPIAQYFSDMSTKPAMKMIRTCYLKFILMFVFFFVALHEIFVFT